MPSKNEILSKLEQLEKSLLKGSLAVVKSTKRDIFPIDFSFDMFTGGLFKYGFVYLWGSEGSGKSTLTLNIAKKWLQNDKTLVLILDSEEAYDESRLYTLGFSEQEIARIRVLVPQNIPAIADIVKAFQAFAQSEKLDLLVIWDSVASTQAKDDSQNLDRMATVSREVSTLMRKIRTETANTMFIAVNQYREDLSKMFGTPEPPGGRALRHKSDLTLLLAPEKLTDKVRGINTIDRISKMLIHKTRRFQLGEKVVFKNVMNPHIGFTGESLIYLLQDFSFRDLKLSLLEYIPRSGNKFNLYTISNANEFAYNQVKEPKLEKVLEKATIDDVIQTLFFTEVGKSILKSLTAAIKSQLPINVKKLYEINIEQPLFETFWCDKEHRYKFENSAYSYYFVNQQSKSGGKTK